MEETEIPEIDPWDMINYSDLLFEVDRLTDMQVSWDSKGCRLGYRHLKHNPRITDEMSQRLHYAREVDVVDHKFRLTTLGSEHLRKICEEEPLQIFGGMLITYCGLDYSNWEAKTHDIDEHPLNSRSLWRSLWRVGNEHGLTESLKEKLQFSDFALYTVKLPDWADPSSHNKTNRHPWKGLAESNRQKFRPFFIKYLKWWFRGGRDNCEEDITKQAQRH